MPIMFSQFVLGVILSSHFQIRKKVLTMAPTTMGTMHRANDDSIGKRNMRCSRLFILMLNLCNADATLETRRSLRNIFNRTDSKLGDDVNNTSMSNVTSTVTFARQFGFDKSTEKSGHKVDDVISPQLRRLGVGARNKKPSDDFIEANENIHRFFDNMMMSMTTEVSSSSFLNRLWHGKS